MTKLCKGHSRPVEYVNERTLVRTNVNVNIARGTTDPEIDSVTWIKLINNMAPLALVAFLGPRGPLVPPLIPVAGWLAGWTRAKNLDQLYSYINHHRTTTNLSDIVWCMSGGV